MPDFTHRRMHQEVPVLDLGLYRSSKNKWIFGVCGGIAEQLGINPMWVRLAVVGLAIFVPGVSVWPVVALYIILGIVLPVRDDSTLDF